jgi:hypothetical protein
VSTRNLNKITVLQYLILREIKSVGDGTPQDAVVYVRVGLELPEARREFKKLVRQGLMMEKVRPPAGDSRLALKSHRAELHYVTPRGAEVIEEVRFAFGFNRL